MNIDKNLTTAVTLGLVAMTLSAISTTALAKHGNSGKSARSLSVMEPCLSTPSLPAWSTMENSLTSPHSEVKTYEIKLAPPANPDFHDQMGGLPTEMSVETFHAAEGTMYIVEHPDMRTDITFSFNHLIPLGVYSLWDVTEPDFANFADRPLADNVTWGDDVRDQGMFGGVTGMGVHALRADQCGRAEITVNMTEHRPGKEFLLDFHANDYAKGGVKGQDVFPGALWAVFPEFDDD
ncbi:MAG: hypothetical protein JKX81_11415 [Arenicella sp.]|nr:hypothetical protein [Arenicella sp.]